MRWNKLLTAALFRIARILNISNCHVPIAIGGVTIRPGDIIVADGDGVIAVPRQVAYDVARYATQELNNDKINRRKSYEALKWKPDETV